MYLSIHDDGGEQMFFDENAGRVMNNKESEVKERDAPYRSYIVDINESFNKLLFGKPCIIQTRTDTPTRILHILFPPPHFYHSHFS